MKNKANCIIIHGCPSKTQKEMTAETRTYDKHWLPWTKKQLMAKGISTETPLMPDPWEPNYLAFKKEFEKYPVNEGSILIGHSCGCSFLVRWLGDTKQKISKLILIAPWKIAKNASQLNKDFYEFDIDASLKERVEEIVLFTSDNEAEDGKKGLKMFYDVIGGEIVELKGRGHYVQSQMGTEEFPELIEKILN